MNEIKNPLLENFDYPLFSVIVEEHFTPAILQTISEAKVVLDSIENSCCEPTFENTAGLLFNASYRITEVIKPVLILFILFYFW